MSAPALPIYYRTTRSSTIIEQSRFDLACRKPHKISDSQILQQHLMDSLERNILLFSLLLNECSQLAKLLLKSGPSTQNNDLEEQVIRQQLSLHNTRLSVTKSDLEYLTQAEAEQIIAQFESITDNVDKLLFWTGLPRDWVQKWAEKHEMTTLTSAMGPLMDLTDARCPRLQMARSRTGYLDWSRYVKGASGIFSRYACTCGIVRVLTLPPAESWRLRTNSTYYTIEEPVLRGSKGHCRAFQINFVHLLADSEALEYQVWPEDHTWEGLQQYTTGALIFMLPPPRPGSICSNNSGKTKRRKYKSVRTCQIRKDKVPSESMQASVTRNQTKNLNQNFHGSFRSVSNEVERPKTNVKRIKFRIEDTELRKTSSPRQPNLVVSLAALDGKKRKRRHTSAQSQSKVQTLTKKGNYVS